MKVVINKCFGGFGLSHKAIMLYAELKKIKLYPYLDDITKKVYGDRANLDNIDILPWCHYSTVPVDNEDTLNKNYWSYRDIPRDDKTLITVVRKLGKEANGKHAELEIIDIPDGIDWEIDEYNGLESVEEKHRSWG